MKIAIDVRAACNAKNGKGIYTLNLVKHLLTLGGNDYILYTNCITGDFAHFGNATIKVIDRHPFIWHFSVIRDFKKEKGELFFAPTSYIIPALLPSSIQSVITVHDLIAFLHAEGHQTKATLLEHLFIRRALKKAARILTPSQNTRCDLLEQFDCEASRITVTPLAANELFFTPPVNLEEVRKKYYLPAHFILAVSGFEPRKNIGRLIDAFEILQKKHRQLNLVIVGGEGWKSDEHKKKIAAVTAGRAAVKNSVGYITHLSSCTTQELAALYRLATVFVFPSLYEGFGLPPLEAMASGCPVVCSNASSLPEVCGDAASYFSPIHTEEMAGALEKILIDKKLKDDCKEKGLLRARRFSWEKTARETRDAFNLV